MYLYSEFGPECCDGGENRILCVKRIQFSLWQLEFHSIIGIMEKKLHHCDSVATVLFFGRWWWWLWPKVVAEAVSKKCKLRFEVCIFLAATTFLSELPPSLDFKT